MYHVPIKVLRNGKYEEEIWTMNKKMYDFLVEQIPQFQIGHFHGEITINVRQTD